MYLYVPHAFLMNVEARRGSQSPGPGVFLFVCFSRLWMLEIEPELSGSAFSPYTHPAISPGLHWNVLGSDYGPFTTQTFLA